MSHISYRELKAKDWPLLESLFGKRGACGGCWCMYWRLERGGKLWEQNKGNPNKRKMKKLVSAGKVKGILAFEGKAPIGWCSFGRREDFPKVERSKAFRRDDTEGVWCVNCFFIPSGYRGQGVARGMLGKALKVMSKYKVKTVEAYPVTLTQEGKRLPPAFSYTGPLPLFQEFGFKIIQQLSPSRPLVRLQLRTNSATRKK